MSRIPVYSDLEALAFGYEAPESPPPVVSKAAETSAYEPIMVLANEGKEAFVQAAHPEARPLSIETGQGGSVLRKRPREEGTSSGATLPPAPLELSFVLDTGRPITIEDTIHKRPNSLVLETLDKACALPVDMEHYVRYSDPKLLSSLMQSCFQTLQKSMVVIDRFNKQSPLIAELDQENNQLEEALGVSTQ